MTESIAIPDVGLTSQQGQRGNENDDHAAWFAVARPDRQCTVYVGVVADGVTSTTGGAQASRIAIEAIEAYLREQPDLRETLSEWLTAAIHHANEEILFEGKRNPTWKGMSTTVVLAALVADRLYVLHLGDSRAYLFRDGALYQLTTDHTWAQAALDAGALTASEAAYHPGRNQLQRYLGGTKQINVARGVLTPEQGIPEEYLQVQPADRILLCTDGIYHRLDRRTIQQIMATCYNDPQAAVEALVEAATNSGEIDDITALLFTVPESEPRPRPVSPPVASVPAADDEITVHVDSPQTVLSVATSGPAYELWLTAAVALFVLVAVYLFFG